MSGEIASIIRDQIGHPALFMIGAKNLLAGENYLSFRISRNCKKVNYVKIVLNGLDLYDIEYGKVHGFNYTVKSTDENIYFDGLRSSIKRNTGMDTGGIH